MILAFLLQAGLQFGDARLPGGYNYARVEPAAVPAGADVRIRVAEGVSLVVGEVPLDLDHGNVVRGKLLRAPDTDTLFCDVLLETPADGSVPSRGLRGTVSIPAGAVGMVPNLGGCFLARRPAVAHANVSRASSVSAC